jgi:hypothetical protein
MSRVYPDFAPFFCQNLPSHPYRQQSKLSEPLVSERAVA